MGQLLLMVFAQNGDPPKGSQEMAERNLMNLWDIDELNRRITFPFFNLFFTFCWKVLEDYLIITSLRVYIWKRKGARTFIFTGKVHVHSYTTDIRRSRQALFNEKNMNSAKPRVAFPFSLLNKEKAGKSCQCRHKQYWRCFLPRRRQEFGAWIIVCGVGDVGGHIVNGSQSGTIIVDGGDAFNGNRTIEIDAVRGAGGNSSLEAIHQKDDVSFFSRSPAGLGVRVEVFYSDLPNPQNKTLQHCCVILQKMLL